MRDAKIPIEIENQIDSSSESSEGSSSCSSSSQSEDPKQPEQQFEQIPKTTHNDFKRRQEEKLRNLLKEIKSPLFA